MPATARIRFELCFLAVTLTAVICCRQKTASGGRKGEESVGRRPIQPTAPVATTEGVAPGTRDGRQGSDLRDEPNTPGFLPRDEEFGKWVRRSGARNAAEGQLARLIGDKARLEVLEGYHIEQVTVCSYCWAEEENGTLVADLELIETDSPLDALGILTVHCPAAEDGKAGAVTRASENGSVHFFGWQGVFFAHLWTVNTEEAFLGNCRQFLAKLLFRIPAEEPPLWLGLLPAAGRAAGHWWVVRRVVSLRGPGARAIPVGDHGRVDQILGLGGEAAMAVAAYPVPGDEAPDYVWLALYPTPENAQAAYGRYTGVLDRLDQGFAGNTLVEPPRGRFLAGTWTADQESLSHVLPGVINSLPAQF